MIGIKKHYVFLVGALFLALFSTGQNISRTLVDSRTAVTFLDVEQPNVIRGIYNDEDIELLKAFADVNQSVGIELEWNNDSRAYFSPIPSHTLHPDLTTAFPDVICGKGIDTNSGALLYFDYNPFNGFRAVIIDRGKRWYIDPADSTPDADRIVYRKEQITNRKNWHCAVDEIEEHIESSSSTAGVFFENEINKYRLAVATTSNYAQFHGGTRSSVMSAIVTTINRVNSVYEIDAGITLELVPNNDQLIFLNAANDPFNNNSSTQIIGVSTSVINNIIGFNSYDIGHVFSTGAGGLAGLFSVCSSNKARGVTGLANPIGDPFDIDYVAHEIGHQFGGTHTQNNSCQRSATSAYEPLSGSTIMGYAGICPPNLQNQSDDYFHHHSLRQISNFAFLGSGNSCATKVSTGNTAPEIVINLASNLIPVQTPFFLTASVSDPENDPWTFAWEQYDLGPSVQSQTVDQGPTYRSFSPDNLGVRYLPLPRSVALGSNVLGERLTFAERNMTFRATARDNNASGSAVSWKEVNVSVVGDEPFEVISPNTQTPIFSNALNLILWDPGNTNTAPINCKTLDVYLSTDNARQFSFFLGSVANSGSGLVFIPDHIGDVAGARLMLKAQDGIFYNLSPAFSISSRGLHSSLQSKSNECLVFPNPANNVVFIKNIPERVTTASITDVSGRNVGTYPINSTDAEINVSQLPGGVFLLALSGKQNEPIERHRIIIVD